MRFWTYAPLLAAVFASFGVSRPTPSLADQNLRISGPHVYENLAVYLLHGAGVVGIVPLTLQEAMAKGVVQVTETGRVNELEIENRGSEEVFIQAGDIVKGGKQDRVLTVSFVLSSKSGRVPISSFCVEKGRWSARGKEDVSKFSSAQESMPSRTALLAMAAPTEEAKATDPAARTTAQRSLGGNDTADKQRKVWDSVAATQDKLSSGLNSQLYSRESATSLQLSLEHEKLKQARGDYIKSLEPVGLKGDDVIGYVVAINGKMSSANLYPSNGLFRKMWAKQLAASVTEAIGEKRDGKVVPTPKTDAVGEFLAAAERGKKQERAITGGMVAETRDAKEALYNEARQADGKWVHRSYLAK